MPESHSAAPRTYSQLTFDGGELVLGARTKLASVGRAGTAPIDETRLEAMLAVAYGRPVTKLSLAHARRAIEKMREGETVAALMHLALTGLGKLAKPDEAAWRLSTTERLIEDGVDPRFISRTLGLGGTVRGEPVSKYSPDQPRVPAGNGIESGRWESGGGQSGRGSQLLYATNDQPPLKRIHPDSTYSSGSARYDLEQIRKMGSDEIIKSLQPDAPNPLVVGPDGRIFDGNTRVKVLEERGIDTNLLPRVLHSPGATGLDPLPLVAPSRAQSPPGTGGSSGDGSSRGSAVDPLGHPYGGRVRLDE